MELILQQKILRLKIEMSDQNVISTIIRSLNKHVANIVMYSEFIRGKDLFNLLTIAFLGRSYEE